MDEGVIYTQRAEAQKYADENGGTVSKVREGNKKDDKTEVPGGYIIIEDRKPGYDEAVIGPPIEDEDPSTGDKLNMGGMVEDELGYMGGGVSYGERGPIKYSKGGAVSGKNFKGSF
jgi:hypothetical protein